MAKVAALPFVLRGRASSKQIPSFSARPSLSSFLELGPLPPGEKVVDGIFSE